MADQPTILLGSREQISPDSKGESEASASMDSHASEPKAVSRPGSLSLPSLETTGLFPYISTPRDSYDTSVLRRFSNSISPSLSGKKTAASSPPQKNPMVAAPTSSSSGVGEESSDFSSAGYNKPITLSQPSKLFSALAREHWNSKYQPQLGHRPHSPIDIRKGPNMGASMHFENDTDANIHTHNTTPPLEEPQASNQVAKSDIGPLLTSNALAKQKVLPAKGIFKFNSIYDGIVGVKALPDKSLLKFKTTFKEVIGDVNVRHHVRIARLLELPDDIGPDGRPERWEPSFHVRNFPSKLPTKAGRNGAKNSAVLVQQDARMEKSPGPEDRNSEDERMDDGMDDAIVSFGVKNRLSGSLASNPLVIEESDEEDEDEDEDTNAPRNPLTVSGESNRYLLAKAARPTKVTKRTTMGTNPVPSLFSTQGALTNLSPTQPAAPRRKHNPSPSTRRALVTAYLHNWGYGRMAEDASHDLVYGQCKQHFAYQKRRGMAGPTGQRAGRRWVSLKMMRTIQLDETDYEVNDGKAWAVEGEEGEVEEE